MLYKLVLLSRTGLFGSFGFVRYLGCSQLGAGASEFMQGYRFSLKRSPVSKRSGSYLQQKQQEYEIDIKHGVCVYIYLYKTIYFF